MVIPSLSLMSHGTKSAGLKLLCFKLFKGGAYVDCYRNVGYLYLNRFSFVLFISSPKVYQ